MKTLRSHRPLIMGQKGAVATNHPMASQAGLEVLRAGGNAVDAAVAAALVLGVAEPHMSGLGGDAFYHVYDASALRGTVYNGSGTSPAASAHTDFMRHGMPLSGPQSVSVPGGLMALFRMHQDQGGRPWESLCEPAIEVARHGFAVTHAYRRFAQNNQAKLRRDNAAADTFLQSGEVPDVGAWLTQPALARTLERIASRGADDFYRGELAGTVISGMQARGVPMHLDDLANFEIEVQRPIQIGYRGFTVAQTPPNSMGFTLLQELLILQHFDLSQWERLGADAIHVMVEAKKLAFADRERYACDPRRGTVPLDRLLSDGYGAELASRIRMDRTSPPALPTEKTMAGGDTTYFCVVDAQGNAVSAIQSLNNAFGSGVMLPETGILLNNRMACWHLHPSHPNSFAPSKRVRHTMNAPMVLKDGKVWALFGTPGADDQVQVNLQMAVGLIDFDQDPQSLVESSRWSSDQPGQEANWPHGGQDGLTIESDLPADTQQLLRDRGHVLRAVPPLEGPCSVAAIRAIEGGGWAAGSDPRRDGWASAF
jgi:gamma-glutamyltranspeptidase